MITDNYYDTPEHQPVVRMLSDIFVVPYSMATKEVVGEQPKPDDHEMNSNDPLFCALSDMASECYDKHDCNNSLCRIACDKWWKRLANMSSEHHIRQEEYEKFKVDFEGFRPKWIL